MRQKIFLLGIIGLTFFIFGCSAQTPRPSSEIDYIEVTRSVIHTVLVTSPPQTYQVTRIVNAVTHVPVTVTPTPNPAQDCWNSATTQGAMNGCAIEQRDLAQADLDAIIATINFETNERTAFDQQQMEWNVQIESDCEFLYGRVIENLDGSQVYARGSMAPMLQAMCEASAIQFRIQQLIDAYLTNDG